jgi:cytidyltransferase-like protein
MEKAISLTHARSIESWVVGILQQYERKINQPVPIPIPILDIAERLFALRCDVEDLSGRLADAAGALLPQKRWMILNRHQCSGRFAFTLAHELAHWLIDGQERQQGINGLDITDLRSQRTGGTSGKKASIREKRANYVASALLMPKYVVLSEIRRLQKGSGATVSELSEIFGVSRSAMVIRLEQLNCIVDETGVSLPYSSDNDSNQIGFQCRPGGVDEGRSRTFLVNADFTVIDHDLYRKLQALKRNGQSIYVSVTERNLDSVEALLELDCVDGIATFDSVLPEKAEKHRFDDPYKDFRFYSLETGKWYKEIQQAFSNSIITNWADAWIFFPRDDGPLAATQQTFLDVSRYIVPPLTLHYRKDAARFIKSAKEAGKCVVAVTGCFDLITAAHVRFLKRAKAAGDVLVVGLESDTRIRAFKGSLRPVNAISQRVELMEAFDCVDFVFVIGGSPKFEVKPFYMRLHKTLEADILAVTAGDPHLQDRKDEIEGAGGKLVVVSRQEDGSSTSLIRRFLAKTEISELLITPKHKLKGYVAEHTVENQSGWHQLRLPLEDLL